MLDFKDLALCWNDALREVQYFNTIHHTKPVIVAYLIIDPRQKSWVSFLNSTSNTPLFYWLWKKIAPAITRFVTRKNVSRIFPIIYRTETRIGGISKSSEYSNMHETNNSTVNIQRWKTFPCSCRKSSRVSSLVQQWLKLFLPNQW